MSRGTIAEAARGRVLVSDGAWGTLLQAQGLAPGECAELMNAERPAVVRGVAQAYLAAGADMVETNSFSGSAPKLAAFGLAGRAAELNRAAAELSRQAAGQDHWVLGSIGPTGLGYYLPLEEVDPQTIYDAFAEQAVALAEGGADALIAETMTGIAEAVLAVRAIRERTGREAICTFTFDRVGPGEFRTMEGVTPEQAVRAVVEAGAGIAGANCGNGIAQMTEIIAQMRAAAPEVPLLVHANAGLPLTAGGVTRYPETPADMAAQLPALVAAGANIVGGCCGTTPAHIAALRAALG
jgi:5-methyltetrahydrofolate--homocysteine methyltransferase